MGNLGDVRGSRAAAYRASEHIRDERTGEVHEHSERRDVAYKEVILPASLAGRSDMAWGKWEPARNPVQCSEMAFWQLPEVGKALSRSGSVHGVPNSLPLPRPPSA